MAKVSVMYSGSSGNSTLISASGTSVLIDAGVSAKKICDGLCCRDMDISDINGIFITHAHTDHIKGLNVLLKKNKIPLYLTHGTYYEAVKQGLNVEDRLINIITPSMSVSVGELQLTPFLTHHDAKESVGYSIKLNDGRKIGFATDLGEITNEVHDALSGSEFVILESNHDVNMLKNGCYPYMLKQRILGKYGHLSNKTCAEEILNLAKLGTTRFILGHISRENNLPRLAYSETKNVLSSIGLYEDRDYILETAPPEGGRLHGF